jgi:hypothetical protein
MWFTPFLSGSTTVESTGYAKPTSTVFLQLTDDHASNFGGHAKNGSTNSNRCEKKLHGQANQMILVFDGCGIVLAVNSS